MALNANNIEMNMQKAQQHRREYDIQQRNMIAKTNLIAWVVPHFVRTILDLLHVKCSKL